jgi:hypothetical protein
MNPALTAAIEHARTHGTTIHETAIALGISRQMLYGLIGNHTRHEGERVTWPCPRTVISSDVPLDLIRHVRNGHPYWEQRPAPMGEPGRGPSRPVPPAPSNAAERHHTAVGIAWQLDVRAGEVERLRVMLGLPVCMTDAEADALIRIIRGAAPSQESA